MKEVLQRLRHTLLVPAAEYVPAITDALDIIGAALFLPDPGAAPVVPQGWRLLKDSTHAERAWDEDKSAENGWYVNTCVACLREFLGHKRRHVCKVCAHPAPHQAEGAQQ